MSNGSIETAPTIRIAAAILDQHERAAWEALAMLWLQENVPKHILGHLLQIELELEKALRADGGIGVLFLDRDGWPALRLCDQTVTLKPE